MLGLNSSYVVLLVKISFFTRRDRFVKHLKVFYTEALDPKRGGGSKDYYTLMFLFDLLTFLITIFGWSSFAVSDFEGSLCYYAPDQFFGMSTSERRSEYNIARECM